MLKERLKQYSELVNKEFDKIFDIPDCPEKELRESMKYSLTAGGKRLRPALILEGYRLFKSDYKKALPFACAMEMIHTFSLIHDDLPAIDNDDLRRGKPTNHKAFGESTAILAGDALLNMAYEIIAEDLSNGENTNNKIKAFNIFSTAVNNMIKGEFVDIDLEGKKITEEQLMYMHDNKTGALIKGSLLIGAILAGASAKELNILEEYAEIIGVNFQIKDDILSEIGDEKTLGKPIGNDKVRGKCTFVTLFGLNEAKEKLENYTVKAIEKIEELDMSTEFFIELAVFIKERDN
ncbi:MAG: polyprenyl synthetase family protein [Clostridiales bacterium]|nr:polyprenyl synthetase family protein [Clostridiales bacterium]